MHFLSSALPGITSPLRLPDLPGDPWPGCLRRQPGLGLCAKAKLAVEEILPLILKILMLCITIKEDPSMGEVDTHEIEGQDFQAPEPGAIERALRGDDASTPASTGPTYHHPETGERQEDLTSEPSPFKPGDRVAVPRSSGVLDLQWTVGLPEPDGKIRVTSFNEDGDEIYKTYTPAELDAAQPKYTEGQTVTFLEPSGETAEGRVEVIGPNRYMISKPDGSFSTMTGAELRGSENGAFQRASQAQSGEPASFGPTGGEIAPQTEAFVPGSWVWVPKNPHDPSAGGEHMRVSARPTGVAEAVNLQRADDPEANHPVVADVKSLREWQIGAPPR